MSRYEKVRNVLFSRNLLWFAFLLPAFGDLIFCLIKDDVKHIKLFKIQGTSCCDKIIALRSSSEICQTQVALCFQFSMYMKKRW